MNVAVIGKETFLRSPIEVRTVVDGSLLGRCTAEYFGFPSVKVGVKVDDADGSIGSVDGSEKWQSDGMIATKRYDSRQCFALMLGQPKGLRD